MTEERFIISAEDRTQAAFNSVQSSLKSMSSALNLARTTALGFIGNEVVQQLTGAARAVVDTRIEYERLTNVLKQAVGDRAASEFDFLRVEVRRLGLEFNSTAIEYAKFAAATRGTAVEGAQTREIFVGIAQAAAAMGLSSEQSAGALLALQQMVSKGKVSAEELRGQLGERLPGAFQIAARAMGTTTTSLDAMLQSGELLASDFLPRFARQLQLEFGDAAMRAAQSTQAAVNQISNAWAELKRTVAQGAIGDAAASGLRGFGAALQGIADDLKTASAAGEDWKIVLARLIQLSGLGKLDRLFSGAAVDLAKSGLAAGREALNERAREEARAQAARTGVTAVTPTLREVDNAIAAQDAESNKDFRKRTDELRKSWRERTAALRSEAEKMRDEIADARREAAVLGVDDKDVVAGIRERYAKSATKKGESEAERARKKQMADAKREAEALEEVRQRAMGFDPAFAENVGRLGTLFRSNAISVEEYSRAYLELIQSQTAGGKAMKEAADALNEASRKQMEAERQTIEQARQSAMAIGERAAEMRLENDAAGYTAAGLERLRIARMQERVELLGASGASSEYIKQLQIEIDERKRLAAEIERKGERDSSEAQQKKIREEATRTAEHTQQALSNAIFRAFEKGSFTAKDFGNLLQATFAEIVLRPRIEFVAKGAAKAMDGLLGMLGNAVMGMATSTAPVVSNGWVSPEGASRYDSGGIWSSISKAFSAKGAESFTPSAGAVGAAVQSSAPAITVNQTLYTDARSDIASIQAAMLTAKNAAVSEVTRQFARGGSLQRMA